MKLFNLGMPKSGTTTLHQALTESGLKSVHWRIPPRGRYVGRSIYRNYFAGADPLNGFRNFDAITQADAMLTGCAFWPQMDPAVLRAIRHFHPDCQFLLLTRDPAKVARSILKWKDLRRRLAQTGAPGLPAVYATDRAALERWAETHYDNMRRVFADDHAFHEVDIEDADVVDRLSVIIGQPITWWGQANINPRDARRQAAQAGE